MEPSSTSYKSVTRRFMMDIVEVVFDSFSDSVLASCEWNATGKKSLVSTFSLVEPAEPADVEIEANRNTELELFQFDVRVERAESTATSGFSVEDEESIMSVASRIRSFVKSEVNVPDLDDSSKVPEIDAALDALSDVNDHLLEAVSAISDRSWDRFSDACSDAIRTIDQMRSEH